MIKKTILFEDLDGNPIEKDFWFNLTQVELTELEHSQKGGLSKRWENVLAEENAGEMIAAFKDIIRRSVGRRSSDNVSFVKDEETVNSLMYSDAYTQLFMELLGPEASNSAFTDFLRQIVPAKIAEQIPADIQLPKQASNEPKTIEQYSRQELLDMPDEKFDSLAGTDVRKMSKEVMTVAMQRMNRAKID